MAAGMLRHPEAEAAHGLRQAAHRLEPELRRLSPARIPRGDQAQIHGEHGRQAYHQRQRRQAPQKHQKKPGKPGLEETIKHGTSRQGGQVQKPVAQHGQDTFGAAAAFRISSRISRAVRPRASALGSSRSRWATVSQNTV